MALVNRPIPSLIGGVSQQPPSMRHESQVDVMENCVPSVASGVRKRTGSTNVARLSAADHSLAFAHKIDRGTSDTLERYEVVINNGGLNVYNLNGAPQTVTFPDGKAYLAAATPRDQFAAVTVADFTFISNKTILTAALVHAPVVVVPKVYVTIKVGVVDTTYFVNLDANVYSYTTTVGLGFKTLDIANALKTAINGGGIYNAVSFDNTIAINKIGNGDFAWNVKDTYGDQASFGFRSIVNRYEMLPALFLEGPVIQVKGDPNGSDDSFYVTWKKNITNDNGVWVECAKQNIDTQLDATKMPWQLVRNVDATWTFKKVVWNDRLIGDDNSNPLPSFLGSAVADIFFFRNRLGFLADENMILSQAGSYFNLFATTARTVVDSDPIDVSASTNQVTFLKYVVPFNKTLLVMSDKMQFEMPATQVLTPKTASLVEATAFEASSICRPAALGRNVYFPVSRGSFTGIREYFVDTNAIANDASDTTAHVPSYVPAGVFRLATAPTEDMVFALIDKGDGTERNNAYVYNSFWNADEKVQSAWHKWAFDPLDKVVSMHVYGSTMVLLINRADGVYMEKIALEERPSSVVPYTICLDRQVSYAPGAGVYDSVTKTTTFTLPYADPNGVFVVVAVNKAGEIGNGITGTRPSSTLVRVPGNYSACNTVVGKKYAAKITLSELFYRPMSYGTVRPAIIEGRLQLRTMAVAFDRTGYFRAVVSPRARDVNTYVYTAHNLGLADMLIGSAVINDGKFTFTVQAKSDEVTIDLINDSHLPSVFQSLEWEGVMSMQAARQ